MCGVSQHEDDEVEFLWGLLVVPGEAVGCFTLSKSKELESTETQLLEKDASLQVELEKRCVFGTTQMIRRLMVQKSGDHQLHMENIPESHRIS